MKSTRLCLVRHGETAWNAEGRVQGQIDVPLSEVGHAQALALAATLAAERFAAVYSSDLSRAMQTAQPVAERLRLVVQVDRRLRERHYGVFQSMTYAEAKARLPEEYARFKAKDPDYDFTTGESLAAFRSRCIGCLNDLASRHAGDDVLIFTHGGMLEIAYRHATGRSLSSPRDFEIPNAALNRIEIEAARWRVWSWADVHHLSVALDDLPD